MIVDTTMTQAAAFWLKIEGEFPCFLNTAHIASIYRNYNRQWYAMLTNGEEHPVSESEAQRITGIRNQQFWDAV